MSTLDKISCHDCRLAELCLPFGLPKEDVKRIETIVKTKRPIQSGGYLFRQGDECQSLFVIKTGSLRSYFLTDDGIEQTLGFYLPGELMGLDALQNGRHTCSVLALETSSLCDLPMNRLYEMASKIPGLQARFIRIIGKEFASDHEKFTLGHRPATEKMAAFLLMLSRRYHALGYSSTEFNLTMRRQDIANFLGLSIETVSRQLTSMANSGVITLDNRSLQINNLASLTAIVER